MPVNPQASQANDANRADQDSPFALLMAANAPKEDEPLRAQDVDDKKPANDQASAAQSAPAKPQTRTESKPKAKTDEKTKPDEDKTAENDGQDKKEGVAVANDNGAPISATETKSVAANPEPPSQPVAPLIVIADAAPAEASTPQAVAPAAATAPIASSTQDLAALTAAQAAANGAPPQTKPDAAPSAVTETQPAPQPQAQSQAQQAAAPQTAVPQTLVSETPANAPITAPQLAAPQPAAQQTAAEQTAAPQTDATQNVAAAPTKEALVQIATLQNPASAKPGEQKDASAPTTTDTVLKADAAKPVTHDIPAQPGESKDVKADAPRPETAKSDSAKPDMAQPVTVETAAPKSAPQVQTQPGTNIASVQPNAATQSPQAPAALPGLPQHVQVSAQPATPNMPALAVEIAAKSQSGAKQFDIRLDPPELGRVEVRLSIDAAGKASAHLSADQPQTLDLLQKDASSLTRALREAGLNVSQDGLNFSLRQQNHDGAGTQQGQGRNASRGMTLIATNSIEATQTSASWRGDGRLDIRV